MIIISIKHNDSLQQSRDFSSLFCPNCGSKVSKNSGYFKKLYDKKIFILRCRCKNKNCKKTHTIMPENSMPGTSIGTKELDLFITDKANGVTVEKAGKVFYEKGFSLEYVMNLNKRIKRAADKIKVIFSIEEPILNYAKTLIAIAGTSTNIIMTISRKAADQNLLPIFFSHTFFLCYQKDMPEMAGSHNNTC